ncbi:MAG: twin-arginine translocase TatA/TatE family subunit [Phenylobacterium sp.]
MGTFTIWHWLVVLVVVALVFGGRGRLSGIMGDAAKGIKAFREGLKGEEEHVKDEEPAKPLPKSATVEEARPKTTRAKSKTVS